MHPIVEASCINVFAITDWPMMEYIFACAGPRPEIIPAVSHGRLETCVHPAQKITETAAPFAWANRPHRPPRLTSGRAKHSHPRTAIQNARLPPSKENSVGKIKTVDPARPET